MDSWANKVGKGGLGKGGLGLTVPTDTPSPQSHARTAALRASMSTRSVSVTSSALTTRAAVLTTWLSASLKVRSEWLGEPGVLSAAGDSPLTLPAVTRGDVFTLPEDDYGIDDYAEGTNIGVHMQAERVNLSSDLQAEFELTQDTPVQDPEEEVPGPAQEAPEPTTTDQEILESSAEELCSGKPFDAFTDLKNGSLFAFRGDSRGSS